MERGIQLSKSRDAGGSWAAIQLTPSSRRQSRNASHTSSIQARCWPEAMLSSKVAPMMNRRVMFSAMTWTPWLRCGSDRTRTSMPVCGPFSVTACGSSSTSWTRSPPRVISGGSAAMRCPSVHVSQAIFLIGDRNLSSFGPIRTPHCTVRIGPKIDDMPIRSGGPVSGSGVPGIEPAHTWGVRAGCPESGGDRRWPA